MRLRLPVVVTVLVAVAAMVIGANTPPVATWSFGNVQLTDLGERGLGLYASLYNRGGASSEGVLLFALPEGVAGPRPKVDVPMANFTRQAKDKVGAIVVEAVFPLPSQLVDAKRYQLVVVVTDTVSDQILVVNGIASRSDRR